MKRLPIQRVLGSGDRWGLFVLDRADRPGNEAARLWAGNQNYAVNVVLSGNGRLIEADGGSQVLKPGVAYQHFPEDAVRGVSVHWESARVEEYFCMIDLRTYRRMLPLNIFPEWRSRAGVHQERWLVWLEHAMQTLFAECPVFLAGEDRRPLGEVVAFMSRLFDIFAYGTAALPGASEVEVFCRHVLQHPDDRRSLPEIARVLGFSYASLRRYFQDHLGVSPGQYRTAQRMGRARLLLLRHSVKATAEALGYSDAFVFSAQFKQETGLSPQAYQKRMR